MKADIIRLLKEYDGYLSGQELCNRLKVSRTAVWKVINQLKEEGYQIEAVRNKGYHLVESADVMTEAELRSCMGKGCMGSRIVFFDITDSTNTQARICAEAGALEGTLVVAERQTAGKGRRGKSWVSPPGDGIWMSLVLRPDIEPFRVSMITLAVALSVSAGIEEVCGLKTQIKWPNDVIVSGKKICGILTELSAEYDAIHYVIVGIGINVNTSQFPEELKDMATSLYLESGEKWKRSPIIASIMKWMDRYYEIFLRTGGLSELREEYTEKLANMGRQVVVLESKGTYEGICRGINQNGELLVEKPDGEVVSVRSGEVSVRGIYGYV